MMAAMLKDIRDLQGKINKFIEMINEGKQTSTTNRLLKICLEERNALVEEAGGCDIIDVTEDTEASC